ncbi:MAG: mechanosensitive ion channel family protein [Alphaproteobacteria bacterium]|nr:mechanosensitive ion channel family protein [Alphaproteobacteria bacterium]
MTGKELVAFFGQGAGPTSLAALLIFAALALFANRVARLMLRAAARTETELDDKLIEALRPAVVASFLLMGLWVASLPLELPELGAYFVKGSLSSLAVLYWAMAAEKCSEVALEFLSRVQDRLHLVQPRTLPAFVIAARVIVMGGAAYFLFLAWDVDVSGWLASAGIVGIAVGFAAQDTLANLFAGVFIIADAPYKIGDTVILDGDVRGRVLEIGMRSTRILTNDDIEIIVPNAVIADDRIVNESGGPTERSRVRCAVGVAYGSDLDEVERVLVEMARGVEDVVLDVPRLSPRVRWTGMGASSVDGEIQVWVEKPIQRPKVHHSLVKGAYQALNAAGIEIPFPQMDVHLSSGDG